MDLSGWIGVIALILAVPLGVASHLLAIRFGSFLERRKLIKTHKTRQQAIQGYERIKAFHEGRMDKYPYYMLLMGRCSALYRRFYDCDYCGGSFTSIRNYVDVFWVGGHFCNA
jgi:hypothetical protein